MSELVIRKKIEIAASPEKVWKVLTDNEFIKQYMFNCYAETDWKPGNINQRGAAKTTIGGEKRGEQTFGNAAH